MSVLGVYDGHNAGAALIGCDGVVMAAVEEERFSRIKNHDARPGHNPLPIESLTYCIDQAGTDPVTRIAYGLESPEQLSRRALANFDTQIAHGQAQRQERSIALGISASELRDLPRRSQQERVDRMRNLVRAAGLGNLPEEFVDHHTAHAKGAFLLSGADDALVVTLDGKGDDLSGSVSVGSGRTVARTLTLPTENSLGHLYSAFTVACGLRAQRDEGKLQAMAAHGKVEPKLQLWLNELYQLDQSTGAIRGHLSNGLVIGPYPDRPVHLHNDRVSRHVAGVRPEDAAATVQAFLEDLVATFADWHLERSGHRTLVVAGGVFANVSLNRRLGELGRVEKLHVHPAMTDAGIALGAAAAAASASGCAVAPLKDVYLGPEYSDEEAARAFAAEGYDVRDPLVCAEQVLASRLAAGEVVARFTGRAEYGPRALGNRSIFAPARDAGMPALLNQMLRRSTVMPFAPLTRRADAGELFNVDDALGAALNNMTAAVPCRDATREQYPAVVHDDGTARPQLVDGGPLDELLTELFRLSGDRVIINTSFNLHDEPMVCRPADAARSARAAGISTIQVGGRIAVSGESDNHR